MTWEKLSQVRLPFGGHLLKRFPEGGYSNEKQYYYPWAVAPEQEVLYQMERFESRAENEEQVLSAVYRRYKEEYERRCLEDGRLERILSLREFFQWLRTQPEGFFAEVELKERGIAGAVQKEMLDRGDFYEVGLNAGSFGSEEVEYLHQKGIQVFSNLGDTPDWWEALDHLEVDGFKTNCLGQYRKWRQKWERK